MVGRCRYLISVKVFGISVGIIKVKVFGASVGIIEGRFCIGMAKYRDIGIRYTNLPLNQTIWKYTRFRNTNLDNHCVAYKKFLIHCAVEKCRYGSARRLNINNEGLIINNDVQNGSQDRSILNPITVECCVVHF